MQVQLLVERGKQDQQDVKLAGRTYRFARNSRGHMVTDMEDTEHIKWVSNPKNGSFRPYVEGTVDNLEVKDGKAQFDSQTTDPAEKKLQTEEKIEDNLDLNGQSEQPEVAPAPPAEPAVEEELARQGPEGSGLNEGNQPAAEDAPKSSFGLRKEEAPAKELPPYPKKGSKRPSKFGKKEPK